MKKYQKKFVILILLSVVWSLIFTLPASAYVYLRPKPSSPYYYTISDLQNTIPKIHTPRLSSGCYDIPYYITSISTQYVTGADSAVALWHGYSDSYEDIAFEKTTNYSASVMDVRTYNGASSAYDKWKNYSGMTVLWFGGGPYSGNNTSVDTFDGIVNRTDDYWMADVYLNHAAVTIDKTSEIKVVYAHEIGHVLGLGHVLSGTSVMGSGTTLPQTTDKKAVTYLYYYR